jgi:ATP-dependent Lon protease
MNELDQKINTHFAGLVVRKDLVKTVKGNAIVPSYVLEYLLGQYCATSDEATIQTGIETVKEILRKHYVHRNEAGLIKSTIKEKGRYKVIDKISVSLNDKSDVYEAAFSNLGIKKVLVDSRTVKTNPKLLVSGVWCLADVEYEFTEDNNTSPWIMSSLKPIQLSHFDFDTYLQARNQFTTDEWIDLLVQSIGFNPAMFGKRSKLTQLIRLIPFCERNYNLIELGPKGTGKSHIYSEFSPHGILISGGEVSVPKLFVNNSSGKIGLVGYWDCVAFDEFAGKQKRVDKGLVDIMKNYMANKSFSRGVETLGAEASMVFVGNTQHTVPYMLKHSDLFDELPDKFYDSAFLDRIHFYIPGWEVDIIRGEMFSNGYGFVVDYLAEILRSLRNHDYSHCYKDYFSLSPDISTRDRDGINKTFSGLMKILFPDGKCTQEEVEELLKFSMEGRKRVKDQLMRIDSTYGKVNFCYLDSSQSSKSVMTLEEQEYPNYYYKSVDSKSDENTILKSVPVIKPTLIEKNLTFQENQKGISFDLLFGDYFKEATKINISDAYIQSHHQIHNFMELLETIVKHKSEDVEIDVYLVTTEDKQKETFEKIQESCCGVGIRFTWSFENNTSLKTIISTDNGWKIELDHGLDIFQNHDVDNIFTFSNRLQQYRSCKEFGISFVRIVDDE